MSAALNSTALAIFAGASLVLGAAIPTFPALQARLFQRRLALLIGFSAGLMLATALHELLPEALQKAGERAMWGAAAGFLTLYLAERLTHFHACRHRACEPDEEPLHHHGHSHGHADRMALVGMSIHNLADGLTTAAAFTVSGTVGLVVVLAIVMHQSAAGLSLGAIMLRAGRSHRTVLASTAVVASFILWGALGYQVVQWFGGAVRPQVQGIVLGLAAGSFLYVAACDLLPEAHAEDEGWKVTFMTLLGYAFVLVVQRVAASR